MKLILLQSIMNGTWLVCVALTFFSPCPICAGEPEPGTHLRSIPLTDLPFVLRLHGNATAQDDTESRQWLQKGSKNFHRGRWSAAAECFTESAFRKPTVEALLGLAVSLAEQRRGNGSCEEEISKNFRVFAHSLALFKTTLGFQKALGKESDVGNTTVKEYRRKLLQAQRKLFDLQRECLNPGAGVRSPQEIGTAPQGHHEAK
jgi:hypothetical protein